MNTGNNLLFLIDSALLGFMAISGVFGLRNLQGFSLQLSLPDEIYCDSPAQATIKAVSGRPRIGNFLHRYHLLNATVDLPCLSAGGEQRLGCQLVFPRRGRQEIKKIAVTSPFPVNFFVRSVIVPVAANCIVFPAPLPLPLPASDGNEPVLGETPAGGTGDSGELAAIGAYTGREPLKLVHWKLTARHDELLVKELQNDQGEPVLIDPARLPGSLEERLGRAAYLINTLMAAGRSVGLVIGDREIPPALSRNHRLAMLAELADHAPL